MGSDATPVDRSIDTHVFVYSDLANNLPAGHTIVASNHAATGNGRIRGEWSHVLYAAIAAPTGEVSATIVLYERSVEAGQSWIYTKRIGETSGPTEHVGVTRRVLKALTPTDHQDALQWRHAAEESATRAADIRRAKRTAVGAVIQFARPYIYQTLGPVDTVRVVTGSEFRVVIPNGDGTFTDGTTRLRAPKNWAAQPFTTLAA